MALTLTSSIDATQPTLRVSGTVPEDIDAGYLFRIGDEVFRLRGFEGVLPPFPVPANRNHWRAERAYGDSVAATHSAGTAVLGARDAYTSSEDQDQPSPFPAGGGTELDADIVAALEAADSPSAANPFVTGLRKVTKSLSAADILNTPSTPAILVAGSPGKIYIPIGGYLVYSGGTAYTGAGSAQLVIGPTTQAISMLVTTDAFMSETAGQVLSFAQNPSYVASADALGADLTLLSSGGPYADGTGTAELVVFYVVH